MHLKVIVKILIILLISIGLGCKPTKRCAAYSYKEKGKMTQMAKNKKQTPFY